MHKHYAWNNIIQDLPYINYSLPLWKMVKCHQQSDQNYPARKATDRGRNVSKIRSDWHTSGQPSGFSALLTPQKIHIVLNLCFTPSFLLTYMRAFLILMPFVLGCQI